MNWSTAPRRLASAVIILAATCTIAHSEPHSAQDGYLSTFQSAGAVQTLAEGPPFRVYHLEFDSPERAKKFGHPDLTVFNQNGRFVDLFAPPSDEALTFIANSDGLVWVDYDRTIKLPPAPVVKEVEKTRAGEEAVARGGVLDYTGKGVTLAVIDSGFDIRHPDFQTVGSDGKVTSRFRAIWDTTEQRPGFGSPAPIHYPDGRSIGAIYDREALNKYLQTPETQRPEIRWDGNGHGTSCAGIAAGNGRALEGAPYMGVAPGADLIGVRVGDGAENTYLITALLAWLDQESGNRPLVISNSWGGHRSGHDGTTLVERQIDERFPADRPGRLVLFAAGNDGAVGLHSSKSFSDAAQPGVLRFPRVGKDDEVEVTLYFDSNDPTVTTKASLSKASFVHGITGQTVWRFPLKPEQESVEIFSKAGKKGHFDAYIAGTIDKENAVFEPSTADFTSLVNNPGNAENVLTVGSYDFNPFFEREGKKLSLGVGEEFSPMSVGDISGYSSPGLTRLGRLKPDFSAPGQWWTAPAPSENESLIYDTSGQYNLFNGTSAATPYAAGVMAILLEKNPNLTLAQIRRLLDRNLKEDLMTGSLPNPTWGRGKLTLPAIERILEEISEES